MDVLARVRAIAAADVLGAIAPAALVALAEHARPIVLASGDRASTLRDGDPVALVVAEGELDDGGEPRGPGAVLGLVGLLVPGARPTLVRARTASVVLEVDGDEVTGAIAAHPDAARALVRALAAVLRGERARPGDHR